MKALIVLTLTLNSILPAIQGATLDAEALKVWTDYITAADLRMKSRLSGERPFLWIDEPSDRRQRVAAGETVIAPAIGNGLRNGPNVLIHHWMGAIFIPHGTLRQLTSILHAYDRYKDFYRPFVAESRVCATRPTGREFALILQYRTMFGSYAYELEYVAREYVVNEWRRYSIVNTPVVREITGYRTAAERALPPGTGTGFVWRLHTISRYEQRENGVYLELEALALTRNIPGPLRWMVSPLVKRMSMDSLEAALLKTRNATHAMNTMTEVLAARPWVM